MMRMTLLTLVLFVAACNDAGSRSVRSTAQVTEPAVEVRTPGNEPAEVLESPAPLPPGPHVDTARYEVEVEPLGNAYTLTREGKFALEIRARRGYRIHPDFPIAVSLRAPSGVGIVRTAFTRVDATANDESAVRFEVPMAPTQAGEANIDATVRFAICAGEQCEPREEQLVLAITVN